MSQAGLVKIPDNILPPEVPLVFEGNVGSGSAIANIFEILGAGSVSTSVIGNTLTITVAQTVFTWNVVTSASNPVSLVANNGYITKGAGSVVFVLPASASVGDIFEIVGYGNLWTITQNAAQSITLGTRVTTAGVLGSVTATQVKDGVEILCVTANTEFQIKTSIGNPTFV